MVGRQPASLRIMGPSSPTLGAVEISGDQTLIAPGWIAPPSPPFCALPRGARAGLGGPKALAIRVGLTSLAISQLGVILVRE